MMPSMGGGPFYSQTTTSIRTGLSESNRLFGFDSLALNEDGSYGRNLFFWDDENQRILSILVGGDIVDELRTQVSQRFIQSGSEDEALLKMEGAIFTGTRTDTYMLVDRTTGVGFSEWVIGQGRSANFAEDDDGNGRGVGFDYAFGETQPISYLSGKTTIPELKRKWQDLTIRLQVTSDLGSTWNDILVYQAGSILTKDDSVTIENGMVTYGDAAQEDLLYYRYKVEQFIQNPPQ